MARDPEFGCVDRWRTAIHEAGHAVMAHLLGMVPSHLVIHGDGEEGAGSCHTQDFLPRESAARDLEDRVDVALAGLAAEVIAAGEGAWDEDSRDLDRAVALLMGHVEDCEGVVRELEASRRRTTRILGEHWELVERLAAALESAGRLGREEILEILEDREPVAVGCGPESGEVP